jgi:hypothetical protein
LPKLRKNKQEYLISLSGAEVKALHWSEGEPLSKCINKGRLIITSLKVEEKKTGDENHE